MKSCNSIFKKELSWFWVVILSVSGLFVPLSASGGWSVVPVAAPYYTPDTGWGIGTYSVFVNEPETGSGTPPDELTFYFTATAEKQFSVGVMPDIYLMKGLYRLSGVFEVSRYPGSFRGTGPDTSADSEEKYTPREFFTDINPLLRLGNNFYAGPSFHFRIADMEKTEKEKILESGIIPGSDGTVESGIGAVLNFDTRNSTFYPTGGLYSEASLIWCRSEIGSEYNFFIVSADLRYFQAIYNKHVLAFQFKGDFAGGDVTFQSMPGIGGNEIMRGLMFNRYMDKTAMAFQGEYRFPLFWRIGGVFFASAGEVQKSVMDYNRGDLVYAAGAGLRFILDREKNIPARLDFGMNQNKEVNVYFLVKEAF